jgi:hypothetical protein
MLMIGMIVSKLACDFYKSLQPENRQNLPGVMKQYPRSSEWTYRPPTGK